MGGRRVQTAERAVLTTLPASEREQAVARIWTLKEAYLKMLGTGIADLLEVAFDPRSDRLLPGQKSRQAAASFQTWIVNCQGQPLSVAVAIRDPKTKGAFWRQWNEECRGRSRAKFVSGSKRADQRTAFASPFFEAQVRRRPEHPAVEFAGETLTYEELDRDANRIANYLISKGVGPDGLVGIYLKKSPRLYAVILGILKAGGGYVPIDPRAPLERIRAIAEDGKLHSIITEESSPISSRAISTRRFCASIASSVPLPRSRPQAFCASTPRSATRR